MKDITSEWKKVSHRNVKEVKDLTEYEVNGTVYKVDGRHVVLDYSQYEKEVADILAIKYGREVRVKNNLYFWAHLYKGSQDP